MNTEEKPLRTGRQWEQEVFGYVVPDDAPKPEFRIGIHALKEVMLNQAIYGWDPESPHTRVGLEFFQCVQALLGLAGKDYKMLRFYCALGTDLDVHHQIDGFFELEGNLVTMDLTTNPEKVETETQVIFRQQESGISMWRVAHLVAWLLINPRLNLTADAN